MIGLHLRDLFKWRSAASPPWLSGDNSLIGTFELRGGRIIGWTRHARGLVSRSMTIEVNRHGPVIARCPATWQPAQNQFTFNLPVESRFTGKELVTESVIVIARDSFGNRGSLRLDGAAQLELIRDHLGTPVDVVLDLHFERDGNAKPYLGAGWYDAGTDARWTRDDDSFISFDAPAEPGAYALRLTAAAFVGRPEPPHQGLDVFVNDSLIARLVYWGQYPKFEECKFSHEVFAAAPRATLRFHHPGAARPSELYGTADSRRLAFGFKRLMLVRLRPE